MSTQEDQDVGHAAERAVERAKIIKKRSSSRRIALLTGGGDAPGLNAVIRAVTASAVDRGFTVIGFRNGWQGPLDNNFVPLTLESVEDIHRFGGTILGSSRTNVAKIENGFEIMLRNLERDNVYALVAIGGEDTLGIAKQLHDHGGRVVGVPKTIDNDVNGTDYTFGFDTAINRVMESMDRLHSTAESHHRVLVVEVMGRHAGWIALEGGIAGGAHLILVPEVRCSMDEVCEIVRERHARGRSYTIIAVAEGATVAGLEEKVRSSKKLDDFGHVALGTGYTVGMVLATEIEVETGFESRSVILGYIQRGGEPTAFDRVLGTRLGLRVMDLVENGQFGYMSALKGSSVVAVPLDEALGSLKTVPRDRYDEATIFFG